MTFEEIIQKIDPTIYNNLRTAIELGKWPDGRTLTREQKEVCLQAVIYYENQSQVAEHERVGYIDRTKVKTTPCNSSAKPGAREKADINGDLTVVETVNVD